MFVNRELRAGIREGKAATDRGPPFTKSNLKLGREMHSKYMLDKVHSNPNRLIKDKWLPGNLRRPDIVDKHGHIIYELKPNNPRAIRQGKRQINTYK